MSKRNNKILINAVPIDKDLLKIYPVKKSHQHDVVYYATCPEPGCEEDCADETGRRLSGHIFINTCKDVTVPVLH